MKRLTPIQKKITFNIILAVVVIIATSVISLILLRAFGIVSFEGGLRFDAKLFDSFKNSWYGALIFILFQTILTILLCAIPASSMAFIILATNIYDAPWMAFGLSFSSVLISSAIMYMLGRFGGYRICTRILGEEDCDRSLTLLRHKSQVYFPLMMLFPLFPDDALVMMAGTIKMKLKWFIPSIIIGRGIGVATIVFGLKIVPFEEFTSLYDWVLFLSLCLFWIMVVFKLAGKLNDKIEASNNDENRG